VLLRGVAAAGSLHSFMQQASLGRWWRLMVSQRQLRLSVGQRQNYSFDV
jgi:hypothetical protein